MVKTFLATILVLCITALQSVHGMQATLTFENDAFIPHGGDHDYTHGTCIEITENLWHYKVGQNMYAPSDLKRSDHIVGDRPYAGLIYGGVGKELFYDTKSSWTHYFELDFGMIGPSAHCKETQKLIHKWLNCKDPKGWDNQLHDEFVVNVQWWTKYNFYLCDYAAIVPRVGVLAGTIQDAVELGCDLKVGYNLKNDVGNQILFSAALKKRSWLDDLSIWAFIGCDERYYLYNHFLEGSLFNNKDKELKVDIEPFVFEWRCGAAMQFKLFYVFYYMIHRQDEFKHQKNAPDYGGICLGWTF